MAAAPAAAGAPAPAQVAAVLSSGSEAYRETLAGFTAEWGAAPPAVLLSETRKIPPGEIYLAFGAKAALYRYPSDATLIYWAPGLAPGDLPHPGRIIKVWLTPAPEVLLAGLKELQPGLKDLRLFYISPVFFRETGKMGRLAAPLGIKIMADRLNTPEELPERLRAMRGKPDAILVLYDPLLVSAQNFALVKNYSQNHRVPLYAPTAGLAEYGAAAALAPTFSEVGRTMARTAREVARGLSPRGDVYPQVTELTLNLEAAGASGLKFTPAVLKTAAKVYP